MLVYVYFPSYFGQSACSVKQVLQPHSSSDWGLDLPSSLLRLICYKISGIVVLILLSGLCCSKLQMCILSIHLPGY
jgi:hypothetical protein